MDQVTWALGRAHPYRLKLRIVIDTQLPVPLMVEACSLERVRISSIRFIGLPTVAHPAI